MVSLVKRRVRRQHYWYLVESGRVNGKPRIVWQKYLGTPARVKEMLERAGTGGPIEVDVALFGSAPLLRIASELRLAEAVDMIVPKRDQGYSVGEHILIAAINRCLAPCSKRRIRPWFEETILPRVLGNKEGLSSQDYWNHMDRIGDGEIEAIQFDVSARLAKRFGVSVDFLYFDPTNFSTYIQEHEENEIPEFGKAKDHRSDLRLIGLALLASRDHGIPLLHRTYPGNLHDSPLFQEEIPKVRRWIEKLGKKPGDVNLVFDKGNNSEDALDLIESLDMHYVGSLKPSLHENLIRLPLKRFRPCYGEGEQRTLAYRTRQRAHGRDVTVVMTYNTLLAKQLHAKMGNILDAMEERILAFSEALERSQEKTRSGRKRSLGKLREQVRELLGRSEPLFRWSADRQGRGPLRLVWSRDDEAIKRRARGFGRTLIFTDRHDWGDEAIVRAYRSKAVIEDNFRRLKDTSYLSDTPQFHWTDSKIKTHQLICHLALQLLGILQRQLRRTGHNLTIDELAEELQRWYQVVLLYPGGRVERRLRPMSPVQEALHRELQLGSYH